MHKILYNYFSKLGLLFAVTYAINLTHKMVYCALLFTILMTILNSIAKSYGSKRATISMFLCTATSFGCLYNKPYFIVGGQPISGLIIASLCAMCMASYIGVKLFLILHRSYSFASSHCISLLVASLLDHFIMALFFTKTFPLDKICFLFCKETGYTYLFACIVYLSFIAILYAGSFYFRLRRCLGLCFSRKQVKARFIN